MDQKIVVGVGNIYASESLFRAGIRPNSLVNLISQKKFERLVCEIQNVLQAAIQSGGTTLKDFRQAGGSKGYFQTQLQVYNRQGQACLNCATPIQMKVIGGRSSYWCSRCQS